MRARGENSMNAFLPEHCEEHMPTGSAGSVHITPQTLTQSSLNTPELRALPFTASLQASPGDSSDATLITALCGSAPYRRNVAPHRVDLTRYSAVFDGLMRNNSRMLLDHARTHRRTRSAGARRHAVGEHIMRPARAAVPLTEVLHSSRKQQEQQGRLQCVFRGVAPDPSCEESPLGQQNPCLKESSLGQQDPCFEKGSLWQQGANSDFVDDENLTLWSFAPGLGAATAPKHALHHGCGRSP